jgi:ribonuclease HI
MVSVCWLDTKDGLPADTKDIFCSSAATNNVAEYEGLVMELCLVMSLGIYRLLISGDSDLVGQHVQKAYVTPHVSNL